jgi:hypothetical protein
MLPLTLAAWSLLLLVAKEFVFDGFASVSRRHDRFRPAAVVTAGPPRKTVARAGAVVVVGDATRDDDRVQVMGTAPALLVVAGTGGGCPRRHASG